MRCPRSVVTRTSSKWDCEAKLDLLKVIISGLVSVAHNAAFDPAETQQARDSIKDLEIFGEWYDSLAQGLGTENVLPHCQAAVAAAAEEIKTRPTQTTVSERLEILVDYLRRELGKAGLTAQLDKALRITLPSESWLSILSGWIRGGLDQTLYFGSKAHHLLPCVCLVAMASVLPIAAGTDEVVDEVIDDAIIKETADVDPLMADEWKKYGWMTAGIFTTLHAVVMYNLAQLAREVRLTPGEERVLRILFCGLYDRIVGQHPEVNGVGSRSRRI